MKVGLLLVAYGASNYMGTDTLKSVQMLAEKRFGLPVRWAFTSETLRNRLARSRTKSDSVFKALKRMRFERYTHVAVQTLHVVPGQEYGGVASDCGAVREEGGLQISLGYPLLGCGVAGEGIEETARLLREHAPAQRGPEEPVLYMAHGSKYECGKLYHELADALNRLDPKMFLATMIGGRRARQEPGGDELDVLLPGLMSGKERRVWLLPMLSLIGRHALSDMAGNEPHSWKSRIERAGLACQAELRSLADDPALISAWLDRLEGALGRLTSGRESVCCCCDSSI